MEEYNSFPFLSFWSREAGHYSTLYSPVLENGKTENEAKLAVEEVTKLGSVYHRSTVMQSGISTFFL